MNHRAAYVGIASVVILYIGLFALGFPVFLDDYDQWDGRSSAAGDSRLT